MVLKWIKENIIGVQAADDPSKYEDKRTAPKAAPSPTDEPPDEDEPSDS